MFAEAAVEFAPLWPGWLTLALAAVLLALLAHGTFTLLRKHIGPRLVLLLAALRLAAIGTFVLIVLQPVLSTTRSDVSLPEMLVLLDTSRSMEGRLEAPLAALRDGKLGADLEKRFRLRWFRFDRTAVPIQKGDLAKLKAVGDSTWIGESVTAACQFSQAEGWPATRALLVTDGHDQGSVDPIEAARRFGIAIDVLPAASSSKESPPTLMIADVQGSRRVLLGSETHFRVTLRGPPAASDRKLQIDLWEDGKKVQNIAGTMRANQAEQSLLVSHRPTSTGTKTYEFALANQDKVPFTLQVVDSKYEILFLDDSWRWEYKFLHRLFEDDPSFRFTALLSRGSGAFVQFASPDRRVNLVGFPQSQAELEGFDLFVLGDVAPARWPQGVAASLARLVSEEGKSLVVIGGPSVGNLLDVPELHAILPVDLTRDSGKPVGSPVDVQLRPDAAQSPFFFQLAAGADELPPLDQVYPPLRKRAGATVLLEAAKVRNPYGPLIVLAEHTVGRGRVLYVGTDTLWKWHTLAPKDDGPTPYAVFWQQAFRALTPERTRLGPVNLWLTPSRSRTQVGRRIEVVAEIQADRPLAQARLTAQATLGDGKRASLSFAGDPADPSTFRAEFVPPSPGSYSITASLTIDGKTAIEASTLVQVEPPSGEDAAAPADHLALGRLVSATGGNLVAIDRPETWPSVGESTLPAVAQTRAVSLWDNFTLLLVLCLFLGADWFLRLYKGLV